MDIRLDPQNSSAFLAGGDVMGHEGADIDPDAVVDVKRMHLRKGRRQDQATGLT